MKYFRIFFVLFCVNSSSQSYSSAEYASKVFLSEVKSEILKLEQQCKEKSEIKTPELFNLKCKNVSKDGGSYLATLKHLDYVACRQNIEVVKEELLGKKGTLGFLDKPLSKQIVKDWVIEEEKNKETLEATDLNDFYKASMNSVQKRMSENIKKNNSEEILVKFSSVIRSSEPSLEAIFSDNKYIDIRDNLISDIQSISRRPFKRSTLDKLTETKLGTLKPVNWNTDDINDMVAGANFYLPPITIHFNKLNPNEKKIYFSTIDKWHKVSWLETPLTQAITHALVSAKQLNDQVSEAQWYARALSRMVLVANKSNKLQSTIGEKRKDDLAFFIFSSRRTPKLAFHLLMHSYLALPVKKLNSYKGTSSIFANRVFNSKKYLDILNKKPYNLKPNEVEVALQLVGTHAHEGSMVSLSYFNDIDTKTNAPLSTFLWHMNYWMETGIRSALPDNLGSHIFAQLAIDLKLPPMFIQKFNHKYPGSHLKDNMSIMEFIGTARQDSGSVSFFQKLFPKQNILASEISDFSDLSHVVSDLGINTIGAGGFFGEKECFDPSLVAKAVEVYSKKGEKITQLPYPVKLGDGWFTSSLAKVDPDQAYSKIIKKLQKMTLSPALGNQEKELVKRRNVDLSLDYLRVQNYSLFISKAQSILDEAWENYGI